LPYEEAPQDNLKKITADGRIKLQPTAAEAYLKMSEAARSQGIHLVAISGFRTLEDQEYLFFGIKAQRGQNASTRAEVSAPPGYSEHHTGYAIDIGDRDQADTHLTVNFEETKAFQWLVKNAAFYSFELSFPKDNPQGVSYEPWHWRYVGDRDSLETFYQQRD
jgi:D-alanyl-D-alanine carboxypeptidase